VPTTINPNVPPSINPRKFAKIQPLEYFTCLLSMSHCAKPTGIPITHPLNIPNIPPEINEDKLLELNKAIASPTKINTFPKTEIPNAKLTDVTRIHNFRFEINFLRSIT
jgi:hypothetical protein